MSHQLTAAALARLSISNVEPSSPMTNDITPEAFNKLLPVHRVILEHLQYMIPSKIVRLSRAISESTLNSLFWHIIIGLGKSPFTYRRGHEDYVRKNLHRFQQTRTLHLLHWKSVAAMLEILDQAQRPPKRVYTLDDSPEEPLSVTLFPNLQYLHIYFPLLFQGMGDDMEFFVLFHKAHGFKPSLINFFKHQCKTQKILVDRREKQDNQELIDETVQLFNKNQVPETVTPTLIIRHSADIEHLPRITRLDTPYTLVLLELDEANQLIRLAPMSRVLEILWNNREDLFISYELQRHFPKGMKIAVSNSGILLGDRRVSCQDWCQKIAIAESLIEKDEWFCRYILPVGDPVAKTSAGDNSANDFDSEGYDSYDDDYYGHSCDYDSFYGSE
ncbi:uncharacterized protein L201_001479 [Kwoniella dendrophila CBS 6074]|uniref:F-box domain-containing protein n=1 Tax=Kwoniella dendrophila CBS 6074 TaxID=1295534 RepID=A0AAX4JME8_9TREE